MHHIAFTVSRSTYLQAAQRLDERGIKHTGEIDRGIFYAIYFRDPLGQRVETLLLQIRSPCGLYSYPSFCTKLIISAWPKEHTTFKMPILPKPLKILVKRSQPSLSADREAKHAYPKPVAGA